MKMVTFNNYAATAREDGNSEQIPLPKCNCVLSRLYGTEKDEEDLKPQKELPEPPTTCCMSGCGNCVWLEYAEKVTEYFKDGGERAVKEINEKVEDANVRAFLLHELRMRNKT